jgi:hypothetical protein
MKLSTRALPILLPGLLFGLLLTFEAALAHGGLSSLGALRGLVYMLIGAYLLALCVAGIILHVLTRRRRKAAGRPFFLRDPGIPAGLRGLMLTQYALAFVCAQIVIVPLLDPYLIDGFDIFYCLLFSLLAVISANGFSGRSVNRGFRTGMVLGWYCVIGACLVSYREGWRFGFEWILSAYGILLLAVLHWKYRPYFAVGKAGRFFRMIASAFQWGGLSIGLLAIVYLGGSLMSTTVFPPDEEKARALLIKVAEAMVEFRNRRGHWPANLGQLDSSVELSYRWSRVEYDADKNELWLKVRIPIEEPDLAFRLSYGFQGRTDSISRMGHTLKQAE